MFLLKRKEPSADTLLATVSELYVRGTEINFAELSDGSGVSGSTRYAEVPGVHWNLHHHWTEA